MDKAIKRADSMEDPFLQLPDELLLSSIFSRLDDLKSLFLCSLVSKHFASVISHVRTVSITVSGSETYSKEYAVIIAKLVRKLYNSTIEQIPALLDSPFLQHMKLPKFLEKLRELQHIHLEYEYPEYTVQPPFPTWEVKFAGNSAKIESFVALIRAGSIQFKDAKNELDQEQQDTYIMRGVDDIVDFLNLFHGRYMEWICILRVLVKRYTSLQGVTITDYGKQGKLVIGRKQLVDIKTQVYDDFSPGSIRTVGLPVLHLPLSGYVIRWVTVLSLHATEDYIGASDDESTVMREAIQVILRSYKL